MSNLSSLKLYMLLLGSKPPNRHVEQHDFFFGIASQLKELIPEIKSFLPEAGDKIHIDAWREINEVDGYSIKVVMKESSLSSSDKKLFFINLGGYQPNKFEEQHYTILTVQESRSLAIDNAKQTIFFKTNSFTDAHSHIDDKYGIDVDDIYMIEDILTPSQKEKYYIQITPAENLPKDEIHLGYLKLNKINNSD